MSGISVCKLSGLFILIKQNCIVFHIVNIFGIPKIPFYFVRSLFRIIIEIIKRNDIP